MEPAGEDRRPARERLAEAALQLFEERGYEGTTVEDVVERARVGRSTFFRVFGTKEDVLFPHHEDLLKRVAGRLDAGTPATAPLAVVEAARVVLRHYLEEGDLARARYRLTSTVPALRQREIAGMLAYQRLFRARVADWLTGRPDAELQAELIAAVVVTAHNFALRQWLRGADGDPEARFEAAMREAVAMYLRAAGDDGTNPPSVVVLRTNQDLDVLLPTLRMLVGGQDRPQV